MSTKSNSTVGGNTDLNEEFNLIDVFFSFCVSNELTVQREMCFHTIIFVPLVENLKFV